MKQITDQINLDKESIDTEVASRKDNINIPEFEIEKDFFETELTPGVYELVDNTSRYTINEISFNNF